MERSCSPSCRFHADRLHARTPLPPATPLCRVLNHHAFMRRRLCPAYFAASRKYIRLLALLAPGHVSMSRSHVTYRLRQPKAPIRHAAHCSRGETMWPPPIFRPAFSQHCRSSTSPAAGNGYERTACGNNRPSALPIPLGQQSPPGRRGTRTCCCKSHVTISSVNARPHTGSAHPLSAHMPMRPGQLSFSHA